MNFIKILTKVKFLLTRISATEFRFWIFLTKSCLQTSILRSESEKVLSVYK